MKGKILISWIALNNDFNKGSDTVQQTGPTINFHQYFFKTRAYKKHLLLYTGIHEKTKAEKLKKAVKNILDDDIVEIKDMNITNVIDLKNIYSKVKALMIEYRDYEMDIFISPGTPAMFSSWILAQASLKLNVKLLQMKRKEHSENKSRPELVELDLDFNDIPDHLNVISKSDSKKPNNSYLITPSIEKVYDRAKKVALAEDVSALILGETGSGKENLAKFIHNNSSRKDKNYIAINCSSMGDSLLESRLFGYKKGAFTGAEKDTPGVFEAVEGGTLFLDEIGDISPYMQAALLRVLQEKEIMRIGDTNVKRIDVRIIAATNKNLFQLCKEGNFRFDLYYRLNVATLELPSLQKRGVKELEEYLKKFLNIKKKKFNNKEIKIENAAIKKLLSYTYPGNLRELENLVEQFYVFDNGGVISISDLPEYILNPEKEYSLKWEDVEREHIIKVLGLNKGNMSKTCSDIGYSSINTLKKRLKDYKIYPENFK